MKMLTKLAAAAAFASGLAGAAMAQDIAVRGGQVYTMAGEAIVERRLDARYAGDSMLAVVVLPWVPEAASTQRSRSRLSRSHSGPEQ